MRALQHFFRAGLALILSAGLALAQVPREENLTLEKSGTLHGTLLLPEGVGPFPTLIIHPGSGPTNRDGNQFLYLNNSLKMLAEGLGEHGIASLRIDKRGAGASIPAVKREEDLSVELYAEDVLAWAKLLKARDDVASISYAGHSEGNLHVSFAATQEPPQSLVLIAAPGRLLSDIIREQFANSPQMTDELRQLADEYLKSLERGEMIENPDARLVFLFRPSVQPFLISMFRNDPPELIRSVDAPVMIVQGGKDIQIAMADFERLKAAREDAATLVLPNMTHVLKDVEGDTREENLAAYNDPNLPLSEGLVEAIAAFILGAE